MSKQTELAQVADTITVNSGNIGIGTSSPSSLLHLKGSTSKITLEDSDVSGATCIIQGGGAGNLTLAADPDNTVASSYMTFQVDNSEAMRIDSSGNVGIGTSSPSDVLHVSGGSSTDGILIQNPLSGSFYNAKLEFTRDGTSGGAKIQTERNAAGGVGLSFNYTSSNANEVSGTYSEAMRIDSSGNLLVGTTSSDPSAPSINTAGTAFGASGYISITRDGAAPVIINRKLSDGNIADFRKEGTTVGSIGVVGSDIYHGTGPTALKYYNAGNAIHPFNSSSLTNRDNAIDLGMSSIRFDDIYATNGTIQTSDRNEKQDIAELSDAEQRVSVASKGLMRKFRWRDAVEAKGDEARTHFGIIAQDLQAAFAAEGLDAGDYAMFISTTWWETQTEVPAVEAVAEVLDEEGNVVTEAVEAVDAYTRTDTYDTQEEAPEGATERTRLGVRYSELLAFIIGAL